MHRPIPARAAGLMAGRHAGPLAGFRADILATSRAVLVAASCAVIVAAPHAIVFAASHADAATLRGATTLEGPIVRLSDLFDDAGPRAAQVLGPAPAPGARIVVEAAQLAAIARRFGVDWRPASPADSTVIDRPGRLLPREDVLAVLREALATAGAPASGDIDLPGFASPLVPLEAEVRASIEQIDYDASSGRFTALLAVVGPNMPALRQRLSGRIQETLELPVAVRRLVAGSVVQPGDLKIVRLQAGAVRGEVALLPAQAVGLSLKHAAAAGQPLKLADLGPPIAVQKGARVAMELTSPGLTLNGQGLALESGATGERITVLNPVSRAVMEAEIIGPDRVRVAAGSTPVSVARGAALAQVSVR
jgi:flagella basal body P-ring formation protein FlgA